MSLVFHNGFNGQSNRSIFIWCRSFRYCTSEWDTPLNTTLQKRTMSPVLFNFLKSISDSHIWDTDSDRVLTSLNVSRACEGTKPDPGYHILVSNNIPQHKLFRIVPVKRLSFDANAAILFTCHSSRNANSETWAKSTFPTQTHDITATIYLFFFTFYSVVKHHSNNFVVAIPISSWFVYAS